MALNAAVEIEVRTTGSDNNGGGFRLGVVGGTDRSQQDAAQATLSAASVIHSTTTQINVALGDYTVVSTDIGNLLQITGGTATAGFYEITVVDVPNNRWTLDRSAGTAGQTVVGAMGGGLATLGKAGAIPLVQNNKIWIKSGTYTFTTASTNVSNGMFSNASVGVVIEGYQTTHGDRGTKPILQSDGVINTFTFISNLQNATAAVINLTFDGNLAATSRGISTRRDVYNCHFIDLTNSAVGSDLATAICVNCSSVGHTTTPAFSEVDTIACVAYDGTSAGFSNTGTSAPAVHIRSIADSNSGATTDGFVAGSASLPTPIYQNCVAYNNGRDGFRFLGARGGFAINCIAEDNAGWGFDGVNVNGQKLFNCAGFSNTSGEVTFGSGVRCESNSFVTGSGSFFTNAAGQDFSLNNTAGAGAAARVAGIPGAFPVIATTGFIDIGAAQTSGGGGVGGSATSSGYIG